MIRFTLLITILLCSQNSQAIGDRLSQMAPNNQYIPFILKRYLKWHLKTFQFPVLSPFETELVESYDHWFVSENPAYYQISLAHEEKAPGHLRIRFYIPPAYRARREISPEGLPNNFIPWFFERSSSGEEAFVGCVECEDKIRFDVWVKNAGEKSYKLSHSEEIFQTHMPWKNPFTPKTDYEVRHLSKEGVYKITYFGSYTNIYKIPPELRLILSLHVINTNFNFHRYSIDADGLMTVYYP
jgi:hypothetical protein